MEKFEGNCILGVLTRYSKQHAGRANPVVAQSILNRRLHTERVEPVSPTHLNRVAIGPPGESMESNKFKVITEPSRVIENVLDDQPRVDDTGRIGRLTRIAADAKGNKGRTERILIASSRSPSPSNSRARGWGRWR